jgi:hypothetical protein
VDDGMVGRLPNFVVIGAQKAGTTTLHTCLSSHPDVFMCEPKEPTFFVAEGAWPRALSWYRSLFAASGNAVAVGEASTTYTMAPTLDGVPERMASAIPDARLVYVVRDPLERIRSAYVQSVSTGRERRPLRTVVFEDRTYVDTSRYAMQIQRYLDWFDRDQLLLVRAEDLWADPAGTLRTVYRFIGVDGGWAPDAAQENASAPRRLPRRLARQLTWRATERDLSGARVPTLVRRLSASRLLTRPIGAMEALADGDRRRLVDLLAPDVHALRRYLGRDFDGWGLLAEAGQSA